MFSKTPARLAHLSMSQKTTIWSLELTNTGSLSKKLIESEKTIKISENPLQ